MKKSLVLAALLGFFSLSLATAQGKFETLIRSYYVAVDAGDFTKVTTFFAPGAKVNMPVSPVPLDVPSFSQIGMGFKAAFPDYRHTIIEGVESKNAYALKGWFSGTNTGSMMGNPPTGNRVEMPFSGYYKFNDDGKITELNILFDQTGMTAQLMKGLPDPNAQAEATIRGIMAAADAGDTEKLISYFAADARHFFGGQQSTNDELKKRVAGFKAAFPDINRSLDEISVNGSSVTIRGWLTGTNTGSFMGAPATGNRIKVSVLGLYKLDKTGKVTEAYIELDGAAVQMQLKGSLATGNK